MAAVEQESTFAAYCLNRLVAVDVAPVNTPYDETEVVATTARNFAELLSLVHKKLPTELTTDGKLAVLPKRPQIPFPRLRRLPAPAPETRWQKFAKEHGIEKRKRSRLVWNEATNEWAPRWGKGSKKHVQRRAEEAIFELKAGEDLKTAVESRRSAGQLAKKKQQLREIRNKVEGVQKTQSSRTRK